MTIEATLLLVLAVAFMMAFQKPAKTFFTSSPRLASRIEYHMATGQGFNASGPGQTVKWKRQQGDGPTSTFE